MKLVGRVLELIWLAALGIALIVSVVTADRRARLVEENPSFCDPFGYLQMAQQIRHAVAAGKAPQFSLETAHTRLLIEFMQAQQAPLGRWDEMVAPLAFHYFPAADHVAVQYPPGAGLLLAPFPDGKALHGLNRLVIAIFLMAGLGMLLIAARKRLPLAAGFFVAVLVVGLEIVAQLDNASFSMNALLAPLLLSGLCLTAAWSLKVAKGRAFFLAWLLILLAGLFLGFAILARIPVVFLLPGVLLLLWPASLRSILKSAWIPFVLGVFLGGFLPLAVHQSRVAGAWYLPTYAHENTTPPALDRVRSNLNFFYGPGKSSTVNWILPVVLAGCVGLSLWSNRRKTTDGQEGLLPPLNWRRLIAAALLILALSNIYFLTHEARVHYYPWPALFAAVLLLALGAFALEHTAATTMKGIGWPRRALFVVGLILSLTPGLSVIGRVWSHYIPTTTEAQPKHFSLPAELADESAWVWACALSGTFWYYARKPAHKVTSTDAETRQLVFKFVRRRDEPQYVVNDDSSMQPVLDEIAQLGGTLEHRGEVDGYPYYLIHWGSR